MWSGSGEMDRDMTVDLVCKYTDCSQEILEAEVMVRGRRFYHTCPSCNAESEYSLDQL
jgi:hypothetical protein